MCGLPLIRDGEIKDKPPPFQYKVYQECAVRHWFGTAKSKTIYQVMPGMWGLASAFAVKLRGGGE
eukprot:2462791-Rhodomonas_salina.1